MLTCELIKMDFIQIFLSFIFTMFVLKLNLTFSKNIVYVLSCKVGQKSLIVRQGRQAVAVGVVAAHVAEASDAAAVQAHLVLAHRARVDGRGAVGLARRVAGAGDGLTNVHNGCKKQTHAFFVDPDC